MIKEVIIEVIAISKPFVIFYTCPYCCIGEEGIKSEIPKQMECSFLESIQENRGCLTPCPICGKEILLKADLATRKALKNYE